YVAAVGEVDVDRVVVDVVEEVAVPDVGVMEQDPLALESRVARHWGRLALPEIGEDQAQILLRGVASNADPLAEGHGLGRLIDALAVRAVFPAVVDAAQPLAFDPARRELRQSVGAA